MDKPEFDPNQSFEKVEETKPEFDSSKAFQATSNEVRPPTSPFAQMGLDPVTELLKTGYNFDTYNKLSPEDKKKYEDLSQHMASVFQEGAKTGASKGLTLGFKPNMFSEPGAQEAAINQLPPEQQDTARAQGSLGETAGSVVGNLPLALATGGATAAATKGIASAAELGPLATRGVQAAGNILAGGATGEAMGIAQSTAPTLGERAKEALPSAALGAGAAGLFEGASAALTPEARNAVAGKLTDLRNKAAIRALGPTARDITRLNPIKGEVGNALFAGEQPALTPLANKEDISQNLFKQLKSTGEDISNTTGRIDAASQKTLAEVEVPVVKPGADVPDLETSAIEDFNENQPRNLFRNKPNPTYSKYIGRTSEELPSANISPDATIRSSTGQLIKKTAAPSDIQGMYNAPEPVSSELKYIPPAKTAQSEVIRETKDLTPQGLQSDLAPVGQSGTVARPVEPNQPGQVFKETPQEINPASGEGTFRQVGTDINETNPKLINVDKLGNKVTPGLGVKAPEYNYVQVDKVVNPDIEKVIAEKVAALPPTAQQQVSSILDPKRIGEIMRKKILNPMRARGDLGDIGLKQIGPAIDKFENLPDTSLSNLIKYRQDLDDLITPTKFEGQDTLASKALKSYRAELDTELMRSAQQLDEIAGTNSFNALQDAKRKYFILKRASKVVERSATKEALQSPVPTSMVGSAAWAAKRYGNQFAATSLNSLSNLVKSSPQTLGQYAAPLQDAASRGMGALSAMHFALYNSDPAYRDVITPLQEEAEKQSGENQ